MSRRWTIVGEPSALQIRQLAGAFQEGAVVLMPTDTIYGLHAAAHDAVAIDRIGVIKGRDDGKPFIVLAASIGQLEELGVVVQGRAREIVSSLWPAPLTAILPLTRPLPASRGAATLAVRIPALPWLLRLLEASGPLVSTSANRSGEPAVHDPSDLARELHERLDAVVDAGRRDGNPSTIVDLTGDEPRLIRRGEDSFTQVVWKTCEKRG